MKSEIIFECHNDVDQAKHKSLRIIHFNDVYNIESREIEPVAGASRFVSLIDDLINDEPAIVLFSGDAFSPSILSIALEGKQMVDILNELKISAACVGNHDFDFGVDRLSYLLKETNFPWLLSNAFDFETEKPLANAGIKHIFKFNGLRIGCIGLVEAEWIATLTTLDYDDIQFQDFCECGKKLAIELKTIDKCDVVIALTHMRMANDEKLAIEVPEIDIILGGHDHDYHVKQANNKFIIKSGSDFRELSLIQMTVCESKTFVNKIEKYFVDSSIKENEKVKKIVDFYIDDLQKELEVELGYMNTELDGRFSKIRTEETNLGDFFCDIILEAINADCVILNSGSFRSNALHPIGSFKVKDLKAILPYLEPIVVISCTGRQIHEALENGVSQYPKLEGRFPQVAGIRYTFDPLKPIGSRVDPLLIKIQDDYIDMDKVYSVAMKPFIREGKDGYTVFKDCPLVIDDENGPQFMTIIENHFKTIQLLKSHTGNPHHRPSLMPLAKRNKLVAELIKNSNILQQDASNTNTQHNQHLISHKIPCRTENDYHNIAYLTHEDIVHVRDSELYKRKINEYEEKAMLLKPEIDGRIIKITSDEVREKLYRERFNENKKTLEDVRL